MALPAAVLLALAGPGYAARLDALHPPAALPAAAPPAVAPPWRMVSDAAAEWRPVIAGADREFLDAYEEPPSAVILRYVALYRLRAIGNALTTSGNRLADDVAWHVAGYGRAQLSLGGENVTVASTETVSGQRRRLVWSFYFVDGKLAVGLIDTKLLQARAVLFGRLPIAAFVAVSASMDNPDDPAERQLTRFLQASEPLSKYINNISLP